MSITLHVRDSTIQEIIMDMASSLNAEYEEDNKEFCLRIPAEMGNGYIMGIQFSHGLGILEYHCTLKQQIKIEHEKGVVHPLKLIFNKGSAILHKFGDDVDFHEIRRLENAILSSIPKHNHIFLLPGDTPLYFYSIEINRKLFEEKVEDFMAGMDDPLLELFRDVNGTNQFYYKEFYSLAIAGFLEEFSECEFSDFMKNVYREGKVYEILSHQLQQFRDDRNGPKERKIIRKATVEKVEKAAAILKDDLANPNSIVELAKKAGLNQNLLQKGFKRMYNLSVNEYLRNLRIEHARELLESTDLNISEISYRVGLNSRSYFSKQFKEKYGFSPKAYRQQYQTRTVG